MLDFGRVPYCSSTVLGKLVALKRRIDSVKDKLKLCYIHPELMTAFRLMGLDKVFEIYANEQPALGKF